MDPAGKTALVTGGAHRLGRAIALGLARAGANIVVNYHSSADAAAATVSDIEQLGRQAVRVRADVTREEDVAAMLRTVAEQYGRLDIVVNNASTFVRAEFSGITPEEWDHVLAVNLKGPFLVSQAAAPLLRTAGGGVIINLADLSAFQPWPSYAHHAASKAGLVHLTRVLARALKPEIRANCIAPGVVLPPDDWTGEDELGGRARRTTARTGNPEDVVEAVLFLVRSEFVTGETIVVDGGRMLL